jgi:hypothetical protein
LEVPIVPNAIKTGKAAGFEQRDLLCTNELKISTMKRNAKELGITLNEYMVACIS